MSVPFDPKIHHPDPGSQKPAESASSQVAKTAKKVAGTKHNAEGAPAPDAAQPPAAKRPKIEALPAASASASGSGSSGGRTAVASTAQHATSANTFPKVEDPNIHNLIVDYLKPEPEVYGPSKQTEAANLAFDCITRMIKVRRSREAAATASASASASANAPLNAEDAQAQMEKDFAAVVEALKKEKLPQQSAATTSKTKTPELSFEMQLKNQLATVHSIPQINSEMLRIGLPDFSSEEHLEILRFLVRYCPDLREYTLVFKPEECLDLLVPKKEGEDSREPAFKNLSTLTIKSLSDDNEPSDSALAEVFRASPALREVEFDKSNITGSCLEALQDTVVSLTIDTPCDTFNREFLKGLKARKALEALTLYSIESKPEIAPLPLLSDILPPQLRTLRMQNIHERTRLRVVEGEVGCSFEEDFGALAKTCPHLETLDLRNFDNSELTGEFLASLPLSITSLTLVECEGIRGGALFLLSRYNKLKSLDISGLKIHGACLAYVPNSLERLYVRNWTILNEQMLAKLKDNKNLTDLDISRSPIKGLQLNEVLPPQLRRLGVANCRNLDAQALQQLQTARPGLKIDRK